MKFNNNNFSLNNFIILQDNSWLERQRVAGKVAAGALSLLEDYVKTKTTLSLIELNALAEQFIIDNKCQPTFKGYKGFPAGTCISVNKQLVHGIPTDYHLQDGDVVSFDLGATFEGAIADSAITCIYGTPKSEEYIRLAQITQEALLKGIEAIKPGIRLGVIGNAIHNHVKNSGFKLIEKYGGHGIQENKPHADPFVSNKSNVNEGVRIQPGMTLAIEPMCIIGDNYTYVASDGWTVMGNNVSAHWENSIFIHQDYIENITWRSQNDTIPHFIYF